MSRLHQNVPTQAAGQAEFHVMSKPNVDQVHSAPVACNGAVHIGFKSWRHSHDFIVFGEVRRHCQVCPALGYPNGNQLPSTGFLLAGFY